MKYVFFIMLLLAQGLQAEVYKTISDDGEVVFTDVPGEGAKPVELPGLTTYKPPPAKRTSSRVYSGVTEEAASYQSLQVSAPEDDATIRDNQGNFSLSLALEPLLLTDVGHRIQYFLDGEPHGEPATHLKHHYHNVDRGTHTVSAAVVDADGLVLIKSGPVTIHLHRISKLTSPAFTGN